MTLKLRDRLLFSTCMVLVSAAAFAQVSPNAVPTTARPDLLQNKLQIKDTSPAVSGKPIVSVDESNTSKPIKGDISFMLKSITVEGATAIDASELRPLYEGKVGQKISLDELNKIATDITAYYRNRGYILTRAIVPPQRIEGGDVKIRVIEGYVSNVTIQGDGAGDARIKAYGDKIREVRPLTSETLERYLLLMEDLPGVEARAVLKPSDDAQGASDIIVTLRRKPVDFAASIDNRGTRYLGPEQISLTSTFNNIFGRDEETMLRVVHTSFDPDNLLFLELRHEQQVDDDGTKVLFSASHIETRPGFTLEPLDVVGRSTAFSVGASHPLLRSRRSNWFVSTDFTLRNVDLNALQQDLYYDKTRVLHVGTSYDFVDSLSAINRMEFNIGRGLPLGTSVTDQPRSRSNAEPVFTKFTGRASRIQPLSGPFSLFFLGAGQYSPQPLTASEEFALGGSELGSAYDPAEISGDSAIAGRAELQFNQSEWGVISQSQFYGFYDLGRVYNHDPVAGSEAAATSLSSTGLGVRFNAAESLSGGLEGAVPLTRGVAAKGADGKDARIFFNLQYRY